MSIEYAIEYAAEHLPDEYIISVNVDSCYAWVELKNPRGERTSYESDQDGLIDYAIMYLTKKAMKDENLFREDPIK